MPICLWVCRPCNNNVNAFLNYSGCAMQARPQLNFTMALQGPTVDQLAAQPRGTDVLKRALADLLPGVRECPFPITFGLYIIFYI